MGPLARWRPRCCLAGLLLLLSAGGPGAQEHARLQSAPLYGDINDFAYYFVDVLVGSPYPQRASLVVDTGSSLCAISCSQCSHCGQHLDSAFDVSRSQTLSWVECGPRQECGRCVAGRCSYHEVYSDGSKVTGSWFHDYVSLGDTTQHNAPVLARLGCHSSESKLFFQQRAGGILGLLPGPARAPPVLGELVRDSSHVDAAVFALCLGISGGVLTVGGYNGSLHVSPIQWTPMKLASGYALILQSVGVVGVTTRFLGSFGQVTVDSGTTYTYFPRFAYEFLKSAIDMMCSSVMRTMCTVDKESHGCYYFPGDGGWLSLPVVEMSFDGLNFSWSPASYMVPKDHGNRRWCYGFRQTASHQTILGATWLLNQDVVFDLERARLGVALAACPEFKMRPSPPSLGVTTALPASAKPVKEEGRRNANLGHLLHALWFAMLSLLFGALVLAGLCSVACHMCSAAASAKAAGVAGGRLAGRREKPTNGIRSGGGDELLPLKVGAAVPLDAWLAGAAASFSSDGGAGESDAENGHEPREPLARRRSLELTPLHPVARPGGPSDKPRA